MNEICYLLRDSNASMVVCALEVYAEHLEQMAGACKGLRTEIHEGFMSCSGNPCMVIPKRTGNEALQS
ncbi:hypothetical protein Barb4_04059 [Bacteroidales bacterium Barb4]|nr:hypothetical protein Barb4_04059 [Bacteroidales bacterium Barb4]